MLGPCSEYQSASCAHFSISASASEKIFPISVEMTFASCALFFLKAFPSSTRSWARLWTGSLRNDRKLLSARATTSSVCAGVKYENASISSPLHGFTVANPALFAPCRDLSIACLLREYPVGKGLDLALPPIVVASGEPGTQFFCSVTPKHQLGPIERCQVCGAHQCRSSRCSRREARLDRGDGGRLP